MLWYKGWLETRVKVLLVFGFMLFLAIFTFSVRNTQRPDASLIYGVAVMAMSFMTVVYTWLAGAGINTQPGFQASKGLHGSTLYTLSLPVSRRRLVAVRSILGWIEMASLVVAFCLAIWLASPNFRKIVAPAEMFEYTGTLLACASALYFYSVFLATFLDDIWRMWTTMATFGGLFLLSFSRLPAALNIIRALGQNSPLIAHTIPWGTIAVCLFLAAAMFFLAVRVAQAREY